MMSVVNNNNLKRWRWWRRSRIKLSIRPIRSGRQYASTWGWGQVHWTRWMRWSGANQICTIGAGRAAGGGVRIWVDHCRWARRVGRKRWILVVARRRRDHAVGGVSALRLTLTRGHQSVKVEAVGVPFAGHLTHDVFVVVVPAREDEKSMIERAMRQVKLPLWVIMQSWCQQ